MKVVVDIQLIPQFCISAFFSSSQNSLWRTPKVISIFIIHHLATTTLLLPSSSSAFFFFWFHLFLILLVTCGFNMWVIVNLWYWGNHYSFQPLLFHHGILAYATSTPRHPFALFFSSNCWSVDFAEDCIESTEISESVSAIYVDSFLFYLLWDHSKLMSTISTRRIS